MLSAPLLGCTRKAASDCSALLSRTARNAHAKLTACADSAARRSPLRESQMSVPETPSPQFLAHARRAPAKPRAPPGDQVTSAGH